MLTSLRTTLPCLLAFALAAGARAEDLLPADRDRLARLRPVLVEAPRASE